MSKKPAAAPATSPAAPARRSAGELLADARQAHASTEAEIVKLEAERNALLLDGDDNGVLRVEDAIGERRKTATRQANKVKLLEVEAKREALAAELARREKVIARTAARLKEADELGEQLEISIKVCVGLFQRLSDLRAGALNVFVAGNVGNAHENASILNADGAALAPAAVALMVSHELFRIQPVLNAGGTPGVFNAPRFPGGECPRLEWKHTPDRIESLSNRLKKASALAIQLLRDRPRSVQLGEAIPALAPAELAAVNGATPHDGPAEETRLNKLLKRQIELAKDTSPEGEAEYMRIVGELAELAAGA